MQSIRPIYMSRILCSVLFVFALRVAPGAAAAPLDPEEWLREAEAAHDRITTYTAVLHKQQRVAGKLLPEETIFLKFIRNPFSLYMKWIKAPYKGSELLYVVGWNEDRVRAHRGGILRFVTRNLDPRDPKLMAGNLRPVTSIGIGYLLETVATNIGQGHRVQRTQVLRRWTGNGIRQGHAGPGSGSPKGERKNYDGCRFFINQDAESKILVRIRVYDQNDQLVENYGYEKLNLNVPLADADFDPKNPEYHF